MKLPGAAFHDQDREASKLIQRQPSGGRLRGCLPDAHGAPRADLARIKNLEGVPKLRAPEANRVIGEGYTFRPEL